MSVDVVFWDVQHGSASYIRSPNNRHIVIDLGTGSHRDSNVEFSPLLHLKNSWGVNQLDYVVVTHPHLDHIDDILSFDALSPKVFGRPKHLTRDEVMANARDQDRPKYEKYFEINDRYNLPLGAGDPNDPDNPDNYGGMVIESFSPKTCSTSNINNHSLVRVISYAGIKVVFTGDNESCSFDELMAITRFQNSVRNADILLASHHGRASGYHSEFVDLVNPRLTVVSDGRFSGTSVTSLLRQRMGPWSPVFRRVLGTAPQPPNDPEIN